jgi:hypothetical protein
MINGMRRLCLEDLIYTPPSSYNTTTVSIAKHQPDFGHKKRIKP